MTLDKDFKRVVRARAERTGQSYAAARRALTRSAASAPARESARYDLWFSRASQGYSGKGARPSGYERHQVVVTDAGLVIETDVAFENYGIHRYAVHADGVTCSSLYRSASAGVTVEAAKDGRTWAGRAGAASPFAIPLPVGDHSVVPSLVARFLPLALPAERGELGAYVPVPEDAYPVWKPSGKGSWFPVMGVVRDSVQARTIVGVGEGEVRAGRARLQGFRYDHVDGSGAVRASTWVGPEGVIAYDQPGCQLRAVPAAVAEALDPGRSGP